ncbi:hypothetical protein GIB67_015078 [Kingdonia uniflora]|uniref:Uncharacterized protein n=1 Tax=Kingdonia uniflora TaxID=39325 RepID=A0A7J7NMS8_9MAGN|nr:hypothetical protein GIB67_015078 [Kingdonia uniflora]
MFCTPHKVAKAKTTSHSQESPQHLLRCLSLPPLLSLTLPNSYNFFRLLNLHFQFNPLGNKRVSSSLAAPRSLSRVVYFSMAFFIWFCNSVLERIELQHVGLHCSTLPILQDKVR